MELQSLKQRFGIIGNNELLNRALDVAMRVAPTDLSVLVSGESGVGKEFFPKIIHAYSSRKHGKYIAVNCGAIPEGTIDSELFGHEKGSFTGAHESRKGYFEEADGGTIFLDEVSELPLTTQVRLLRVLQAGEYIKVGSSKVLKTDVRVVAATNRDPRDEVAAGRFREDLYYRLNTVPIVVPPLRERSEDIYFLFRKFATDIALQYRMPPISLDQRAREMLEIYSWPGNIRQLKNVAEQISAVEESRLITEDILKRYLPKISMLPAIVEHSEYGGKAYGSTDRDLLFKVFFDLREDINELKMMVSELISENKRDKQHQEIAGLLPSPSPYADYMSLEEQEEAQEMTKQRVMRDAIVGALKRNGGRRKEAAKELFISERTLYRRIKELGLEEY